MAKSVKDLKIDIDGVECKETVDIFTKLKESGLKPYILNKGIGGYTIKVHYKTRYFVINARTKKFQYQYLYSKATWITYKNFKDLIKQMQNNVDGKYEPSNKMKEYLLSLISRFPNAYNDAEIKKALNDYSLCEDMISVLVDKTKEAPDVASEKQLSYIRSLLSSLDLEFNEDWKLTKQEAMLKIVELKELKESLLIRNSINDSNELRQEPNRLH